MTWQPQIHKSLLENNYLEVARFYEQVLETEPDVISHYWHLGLSYLLLQREEEAQATWFSAFVQDASREDEWTTGLIQILETEAQRQESNKNASLAWLIRGHICELAPDSISNILRLLQLDITLNFFTPARLNDWQSINLLQQSLVGSVDSALLLQTLTKLLEFPALETVAFAEASVLHFANSETFVNAVMTIALKMASQKHHPSYAADLAKICLKLQPDDLMCLNNLFGFHILAHNYQQALETAHQFYNQGHTLSLKIFGNYQLLWAYMSCADWQAIAPVAQRHKALLTEVVQQPSVISDALISNSFIGVVQPLQYFQDYPQETRKFQNQIAKQFQQNIQDKVKASVQPSRISTKDKDRPLKIGYIGHTFKMHSVGWLGRWLLHHHDKDAFQIGLYLVNQKEDALTEKWFRPNADIVRNFSWNYQAIVEQIRKDEIDILIDLDSLSHNQTYLAMAHKPAPVQVTWLGLDASGLPAIDYFIADPYVLPEDAQTYYQEKIWRLPHTYLAVDGFEVDVPTLRREHIDIPINATVYLSVQNGHKRHPDTIRLQMQIIKAVPNSYFLIKGSGDEALIKQLFTQIAQEEGVNPTRLRFLKRDPNELIHRANLQIADVVLDTYPYNGATTTLEVLWMGIPLVTRVGQQFAARNSYTFMTNAGITEGIAWSADEYVQWGIRLGKNKALREHIALKLRASRQTSPLWNAEQFTREIEKAYRGMWTKYCM